ncbi:hypothetical protein IAR50_007304 [Cryptococcus sp. DSM 104548]
MSTPSTPTQAGATGETAEAKQMFTISTVCYFPEGDVHFITSDNVLFYFDLKCLAEVSSFFTDLNDVPQPPGAKTAAPVSSQTLLDTLGQLSIEDQEDLGKHTNVLVVYPECSSKALQPWLDLVYGGGKCDPGMP